MRLSLSILLFLLIACGGSKPDAAPAAPAATEAAPAAADEAPATTEEPPDAPPPAEEAESAEGSTTEATDEQPTAVVNEDGAADGESCLTGDDCASGICEGIGCGDDMPGTCMARMRPCTKDLRPMCDCEGNTFQASSSCPGRRVEKKVPCDVTAP